MGSHWDWRSMCYRLWVCWKINVLFKMTQTLPVIVHIHQRSIGSWPLGTSITSLFHVMTDGRLPLCWVSMLTLAFSSKLHWVWPLLDWCLTVEERLMSSSDPESWKGINRPLAASPNQTYKGGGDRRAVPAPSVWTDPLSKKSEWINDHNFGWWRSLSDETTNLLMPKKSTNIFFDGRGAKGLNKWPPGMSVPFMAPLPHQSSDSCSAMLKT